MAGQTPWSGDTVADVMTHAVAAVGRDASVDEVVETLHARRVSALPVLAGDGRVIGVVSEADVLAAELPDGPGDTTALTAGRLMSSPAVTVHPEAALAGAARAMLLREVKRLPVVDADGHLRGIVSRADVLKIFLRGDDDVARHVRFELLAALDPQTAAGIDVAVAEGRVHLSGRIPEVPGTSVLTRLVQGVPGVVDVAVDPVPLA
ncbi:CBS domain-containing protein [Streptacidiphilus anmyonensis]|uniref:CBS domain-containing protein n=1 Tax=Streptacidiphilus anmyonensis TaxID=405782 RepID=UPI0005A82B1E|nr:CBS domain-containing protein [Streptacidiphilus anmyonensis]